MKRLKLYKMNHENCPYRNPKTCEKVRMEKLKYETETHFICGRCNLNLCVTYRYSPNTTVCWPCGLKMPEKNIPKKENLDLR